MNILKGVFHYIYCMPLYSTALAVILAGFIWRYIDKNANTKKEKSAWHCMNGFLFVVWVCVVLYMTIISRPGEFAVNLTPFHFIIDLFKGADKEIFRTAWMNIILFVPGALFLEGCFKTIGKKKRISIVLALFLMSLLIEGCQLVFKLGVVEIDDVICNTIGALVGVYSDKWVVKIKQKLIKILKEM